LERNSGVRQYKDICLVNKNLQEQSQHCKHSVKRGVPVVWHKNDDMTKPTELEKQYFFYYCCI